MTKIKIRDIPTKLNFGCGQKILPGYFNVDIVALPGVDRALDLNSFPYPFPDNHFEEVYADNVFEHLADPIAVIEELHRIIKFGGIIVIKVPHFTSHDAWAHPQHTRAFAIDSFDFFVQGTKRHTADGRCFPFSFSRVKKRNIIFEKGLHPLNWFNYILEPLVNLFPEWYEKTPLRVFPASSIEVVIRK